MRKTRKILFIIIVIVVLFYIINSLGFLYKFNEPVNKLIAGKPNKNCRVDEDCSLLVTECRQCACPVAVNKNWDRLCLFKRGLLDGNYICEPCPPTSDKALRCINNQCDTIKLDPI